MPPLSVQTIENTMDAMAAYIDRMYFTAPFNDVTCGFLANNPGFPLWIEARDRIPSSASAKALKLWNGSGNDTPPEDWEQRIFNDIGWGDAVAANNPPALPDSAAISICADGCNPAPDESEMLIRHHFELPPVPIGVYSGVDLRIEDRLLACYINGHYLGAITQDAPNNTYNSTVYTIDPSYLIPGDDNVLALRVANSDGNQLGVCYEVDVRSAEGMPLGQYNGETLNAHSAVSGQAGAPTWLGAASESSTLNQFDFGLDASGWKGYRDLCGRASRNYAVNGQVLYKIEDITTPPLPNRTVWAYLGDSLIIPDVAALPADWSASVIKSDAAQNYLRSLSYADRYGFELGRIVYLARGDTVKAGYFANSEQESGFLQGLYDVLYGDLDAEYPEFYQWHPGNNPPVYKDLYIAMNGGLTTSLPQGIADDGCYFYPRESALRGTVYGLPLNDQISTLSRFAFYTVMQWALHLLKKHGDLYRRTVIPGYGYAPPTLF